MTSRTRNHDDASAPVRYTLTRLRAGRGPAPLPHLMTVGEVAEFLRTTRKAVYGLVARAAIPGIVRIGRRVLFDSYELQAWIEKQRMPSQKWAHPKPGKAPRGPSELE